MTTTEAPTFSTVPLTRFRPTRSLGEFLGQVKYAEERGRYTKFEGDHLLLDHLDRALKSLALQQAFSNLPGSGIDLSGPHPVYVTRGGELPSVSELDETTIYRAIDAVEARIAAWLLDGDDGMPIKERLDMHFAPQQARWLEVRQAQEEHRRVRAESQRQADVAAAERADREYRAVWGLPQGA